MELCWKEREPEGNFTAYAATCIGTVILVPAVVQVVPRSVRTMFVIVTNGFALVESAP